MLILYVFLLMLQGQRPRGIHPSTPGFCAQNLFSMLYLCIYRNAMVLEREKTQYCLLCILPFLSIHRQFQLQHDFLQIQVSRTSCNFNSWARECGGLQLVITETRAFRIIDCFYWRPSDTDICSPNRFTIISTIFFSLKLEKKKLYEKKHLTFSKSKQGS